MRTTPEQIKRWLAEPSEYRQLEFKEAKEGFGKPKLLEYCVAIANEGGGHLVLGVSDAAPRRIVGTQAFQNPAKIEHEVLQKICLSIKAEEIRVQSRRMMVFYIPSRPKGMPVDLDGKYLMRSGESTVPMSPDRLQAIFSEGRPNWLDEYAKTGLSAMEADRLLDIRACYELMNRPYPAENLEDALEPLIGLHCVEKNGNGYAIPRMGALLLARRLSDFPELEYKAVRTVVYDGISKEVSRLDWTSESGYAVGFKALVREVTMQLPQHEAIQGALRTEIRLCPEEIVRELIANAMVHQDFAMTGSQLRIEIYRDRMEVSNPGTPLIPVERFIDRDRTRNDRLANMMRRLGICEQKGSGIDHVVWMAELHQLQAPEFIVHESGMRACIRGSGKFSDMSPADRVRACYQHCALQYVKRQPMTNQSLRERFGMPTSRPASTLVSKLIRATTQQGLIKPDKGYSKKFAQYIPFWS